MRGENPVEPDSPPRNHPTLPRLPAVYALLPFAVFPLAIVWPFLPDVVFEQSLPVEIDGYMRSLSAKWLFESSYFEGVEHTWGVRYTTLIAMCVATVAITQVALLAPAVIVIWKFDATPLTSENKKLFWVGVPFLMLFLWFLFFDKLGEFDLMGGRRTSKLDRWTDTWIIFPFMAMSWALSAAIFSGIIIVVTKMLRHAFRIGRPRDARAFAHHNRSRD